MKIGFDLDDTLNVLAPKWIAIHNLINNDDMQPCYVKDWSIASYSNNPAGFMKILEIPGLFKNLDIRLYAEHVLYQAHKDGHEIYIVTAYIPEACVDKVHFIMENFPYIKKENIIFINNKKLLKLDALFDDGPHNFGLDVTYKIIMDRPWNKNSSFDETSCYNYRAKTLLDGYSWLMERFKEEQLAQELDGIISRNKK